MGFLAPAVPWLIQGGAALGGALFGKKAQQSAMQRSPEEMQALTGAQNIAGGLSRTGSSLIGQGTQTLGAPTNYWSTLLSGNRAQMAQATAAPRAAISDVYSGAERNLERSGVRGAARDVAGAELGRERAGKIAGLTTGVQPAAAQELSQIGENLVGRGAGMYGQAGSIYSNLLGHGTANRIYGRQEGEKASTNIGGLIFDILQGTVGKKFGGGQNLSFDRPGPGTPAYYPGGIDPYRMY
jgi:hypothetical protein